MDATLSQGIKSGRELGPRRGMRDVRMEPIHGNKVSQDLQVRGEGAHRCVGHEDVDSDILVAKKVL